MTDFAQDGKLLQMGGEAASASLVPIHSYPRPHVLVAIYIVALASVADPRLFDPRVGDDKTYIYIYSVTFGSSCLGSKIQVL